VPFIRNIVCAVDVTDLTSPVIQYGAGLASAHRAQLLIVYVFNAPLPLRMALPQYAGEMLDSGARCEMLADLDRLAEPLRQRGISVRTFVCEGKPARELVRVAQTHHGDMIVMGTQGRTGVGRLVLGSVAEETIRSAGCPVLTVPPRTAELTGDDLSAVSFKRILCPVDFSPESATALEMAIALAEHGRGTVRILHVAESFDQEQLETYRFLNVPEYPQQAVRDAYARLTSLVPHAARCELRVLGVAVAQRPYRAVLREAEAHPTDLIALGVRGRGAADMLVSGSTTNRVLREARCPVLTTHAAGGVSLAYSKLLYSRRRSGKVVSGHRRRQRRIESAAEPATQSMCSRREASDICLDSTGIPHRPLGRFQIVARSPQICLSHRRLLACAVGRVSRASARPRSWVNSLRLCPGTTLTKR
jgi:universal stress protein E